METARDTLGIFSSLRILSSKFQGPIQCMISESVSQRLRPIGWGHVGGFVVALFRFHHPLLKGWQSSIQWDCLLRIPDTKLQASYLHLSTNPRRLAQAHRFNIELRGYDHVKCLSYKRVYSIRPLRGLQDPKVRNPFLIAPHRTVSRCLILRTRLAHHYL